MGTDFNLSYNGLVDGIPNPNEKQKLYQKDGVYNLLPIKSTDAYLFKGWKMNGEYVTSLDPIALWDPSAPTYDKDAYTFVLTADIEFYDFNVNYYVDDKLFSGSTFNFKNFKTLQEPTVPVKEHYTGHWSEKVTAYRDYNIKAIYEIDKFSVGVQTNIGGYTIDTKQYEYGTTYKSVYDQLSYANKMLMGLYLEPDFSTRVDESAIISADDTLYAKWSDKYDISSVTDWALLKEHSDAYFTIENDLNFLGEPIPVIEQFNGILDGQNHTVSNFINQNNTCPQTYGLFGTNNGTISNINFANGVYVATTSPCANTITVGFLSGINCGKIENVRVADTTIKITCKHSTSPLGIWLGSVEGKIFAGVLAGSNKGEIAYSTLTDTVNANMDTTMYAATGYNLSDNYIRVWATYGLIAGDNDGQIDHVTVASTLSSTASRTESLPDGYSNYFRYVYFPLRVGGVVGSNQPKGTVNDSGVSAKLTVDHAVSARRTFLGLLDIGGVSGVNSGKINCCQVDKNVTINAYANAETRVGGNSGTNDGDGMVKSSYTYASFAVGNRSNTEKTYWGGIVGLNDAAITYCYAVIDSMGTNPFGLSEAVNVGGLLGKGTTSSSVLNSFVTIVSNVPQANIVAAVVGTHDGATIMNCYTYLTPKANGFDASSEATKCDTEADLLTEIAKLGYENMGFSITGNEYPVLPNADDQ